MKLGSVEFFKKVIVGGFIFLLLLPIVLAIVFGVLYAREKSRANWLEAVNAAMLEAVNLPDELTDPADIARYLADPPEDVSFGPSFEYQTKYPSLYASRPEPQPDEGKTCYLTFDDGPSPVTMQVLKTLADYNVKATFFVTGQNSVNNADVLKAAAEAGHTIGVHTFSHNYQEIYASVDAFLEDFEKMYTTIEETVGIAPTVFRFAGGSVNVYNQTLYTEIIAEMTRRGFVFYDWNVAANDAVTGGISRAQAVSNVVNGAEGLDKIVVLMHDRQDNATTAAALPEIIETLSEKGYSFAPLTAAVQPITFFYTQLN